MNQNLLLEIQRFAAAKGLYHRDDLIETIQLIKISLKLLDDLPVLRDSIFDYFSLVFDSCISNYVEKKNNQLNESDSLMLMIKEGLESLIIGQSWAPVYVSQWTLSRLVKPSEYAKVLNLDFKGACNLWIHGCTGTRALLDICGLCFKLLSDNEMKRFIFDLENVFVDNRPNFDWCVAHLSSLFPMKFISNILRMPSMLAPAYISSTVTVLEYLSNAGDQKLKVLIREIVDEALNGDTNDLKSKDYIPNLIQLSSKSEVYAQSVLNVFLEYIDQGCNNFLEKIKRQIQLRPLDYNSDKLQEILPDLIIRSKENGAKLLLTLIENFDNNLWTVELVEIVITELESKIHNNDDKINCSLLADIRKEKNWSILFKACSSRKKLLQQTALRLIILACNQKNPVMFSKAIENLLSMNTLTQPHIFNALIRLLDDNGMNDNMDINIAISHVLQQLLIDLNISKKQNTCYFTLKNLVDIISLEKDGQCAFLKRGMVTGALQSSFQAIINIWDKLLCTVLRASKFQSDRKHPYKNNIESSEADSDDPMQIADIDSEALFGAKDQIHILTNLINHLNLSSINISNAVRCEKITVKYFFWCLTETDPIVKSIIMERCYNLLSKQCSDKRDIRNIALRDLLEGALFLYPDIFISKASHVQNTNHIQEESLLKLNQRQMTSINYSKSSILHSGVIGSGICKNTQNNTTNDVDAEIKNIYIKAIVSCCQDESNDENHSKIIDGLCSVSELLVELVCSDVMYNERQWPIEEDFAKIVTMERDLHIRRIFKSRPILWSILGLLGQYRLTLWCNCSVFLRALCASIMHHWRAKSENRYENNDELMFFTVNFLELLALAKLLPPPLNNLHIVVLHLQPSEIAYVLKECVWNYFVAKGMNNNSHVDQTAEVPLEQFINPLRNTMQKKLSTLGNLYYQMKFN